MPYKFTIWWENNFKIAKTKLTQNIFLWNANFTIKWKCCCLHTLWPLQPICPQKRMTIRIRCPRLLIYRSFNFLLLKILVFEKGAGIPPFAMVTHTFFVWNFNRWIIERLEREREMGQKESHMDMGHGILSIVNICVHDDDDGWRVEWRLDVISSKANLLFSFISFVAFPIYDNYNCYLLVKNIC